jgi:putative tricarboxylic transport membrane protein
VLAWVLEANDFPITPLILGVVLGGMLEEHLVSSLIKADGNVLAFFARPIAAGLGIVTFLVWLSPLLRLRRRSTAGAAA